MISFPRSWSLMSEDQRQFGHLEGLVQSMKAIQTQITKLQQIIAKINQNSNI
jgi:hypothetical protein